MCFANKTPMMTIHNWEELERAVRDWCFPSTPLGPHPRGVNLARPYIARINSAYYFVDNPYCCWILLGMSELLQYQAVR